MPEGTSYEPGQTRGVSFDLRLDDPADQGDYWECYDEAQSGPQQCHPKENSVVPTVHRFIGIPYDEEILPRTHSMMLNHGDSKPQDGPDN